MAELQESELQHVQQKIATKEAQTKALQQRLETEKEVVQQQLKLKQQLESRLTAVEQHLVELAKKEVLLMRQQKRQQTGTAGSQQCC
jgi:phosphopantetheinyl transferase (holo-ACP synthase)